MQPTVIKRRLVLMRHAKSDWEDPSLSDHDRPLNKRGRRAAPAMAEWLAEVDSVPDLVLSSTSLRTCETLDLMLPEWPSEPETRYLKSLYLAPAESILQAIRDDGNDAKTILVLAHNPGMAHLVSCLTDKYMDMPTAAAAVFRVDIDDWQTPLDPDNVKLVQFMRPKALH